VIEGIVEKFENLIIRSAEEFEEKSDIRIIKNTRATKIKILKIGILVFLFFNSFHI